MLMGSSNGEEFNGFDKVIPLIPLDFLLYRWTYILFMYYLFWAASAWCGNLDGVKIGVDLGICL